MTTTWNPDLPVAATRTGSAPATPAPLRASGVGRLTLIELRKSLSTRAGQAVLVAAALLGPHWIPFFVLTGGDTSTPVQILAGLGSLTGLLLLALGVMSTAGEWTTGAIQSTFLTVPGRGRVLVSKTFALVLLGAAGTTVGTLLSAVLLVAFGVPLPLGPTAVVVAMTAAGGAAFAAIGVGIGAAVGNTAGAMTGSYLTLFLAPPLLQSLWPQILDWIDPHMAVVGIATGDATPARITAVGGWLVIALVAGALANRRRDVS